MSTITSTVPVAASPAETFRGFVDFDGYRNFMASVDTVRTDDEGYVYFGYSIGPIPREFVIEVTIDEAARTLSWRTVRGPEHSGTAAVVEHPDGSEVRLRAEFEPHGPVETVGDTLGLVRSRVEKDLRRFAAWVAGGYRSGAPEQAAEQGRSPSQRLTDAVFPESRAD